MADCEKWHCWCWKLHASLQWLPCPLGSIVHCTPSFHQKSHQASRHCFVSLSLLQSAGVMSVYLFMKRYTAEEMYRPHSGFYRPRLSNCSDYSGQFLHPEAWVRGRSPSDISSDASLQMNSNYPALLKCPDYDQLSSSPCWRTTPLLLFREQSDNGGRGSWICTFLFPMNDILLT